MTHRHHHQIHVFADPARRHRFAIISRIANAVGTAERQFQRTIGADWTAAYRADWSAADETYCMLVEPERPFVLPRPHMIENKS